MEIIAVSNIKGGVGKTTAAVNLAYLSAASGRPTLLWDLDPQGAATYTLRGEANERASAKKLVNGKQALPELIAATSYEHLDLLPADRSFRRFDVHMSAHKHPTERLLRMSRAVRDTYARLFLDCPAGMSLLSENVLRAADAVVVPVLPTPLSLRMLEHLCDFVERENWPDLRILPFFSMVDRRRRLHEDLVVAARQQFPTMLATEVPYWSEIERMTVRRAPLAAFGPNSPGALVFSDLWSEIASRLT
jgi:chromosome partitioning protein